MTPEQIVRCSAPYCREKATVVMYEDPATRLAVRPSDPKGKPRGYCTEHNGERLSEAMKIRRAARESESQEMRDFVSNMGKGARA